MKDPTRLKQYIIEHLDMAAVMQQYGVEFQYNPQLTSEVQFRCPFHGRDRKPSARLYNTTRSAYCWFCKEAWDVISFIARKENLPYRKAMLWIVNRYGLDVSSIPDEPEIRLEERKTDEGAVQMQHLRSLILDMRGKLEFDKYRALGVAWYMILCAREKGMDVSESARKLEEKILMVKGVPCPL